MKLSSKRDGHPNWAHVLRLLQCLSSKKGVGLQKILKIMKIASPLKQNWARGCQRVKITICHDFYDPSSILKIDSLKNGTSMLAYILVFWNWWPFFFKKKKDVWKLDFQNNSLKRVFSYNIFLGINLAQCTSWRTSTVANDRRRNDIPTFLHKASSWVFKTKVLIIPNTLRWK